MKNVRSSQVCILMNFCTEFSKVKVLPCEYCNRYSYIDVTTYPLTKYFIILLKEYILFIGCLYYLSIHFHSCCFYVQYHGLTP